MGYSCRTLLRDTLSRHSSGTLLRDTLVGLSSSCPVSFQLPRYSTYYSCTTRSPVLSFHLHRTNRTLACISRTQHARSPQRVARAWDKSHSRLHFAHSTRTISAEGCARMGQIALSPAFRALDTHDLRRGLRAHGTNRTLACIWCTRRARSPQRVARQVSKTSVSYETSSKTHTSKSAKRAFRTRLPPKVKRKHPSEHTHITQPCQAVSRFQLLQTTSAHTPIPMGQRHSPQLTTSRFPAPATNLSPSTRLTRTKYCACHEMSPPSHLATSRFPAPATRIALPRFKSRTKSCACHEK